MTLVDASIRIEHFRRPDAWLQRLLAAGAALGHPFVIGGLALGRLPERGTTLRLLHRLPPGAGRETGRGAGLRLAAAPAGAGIGYVDAHLLAAAALAPPARPWSGDRRLAALAGRLGLGVRPEAWRPPLPPRDLEAGGRAEAHRAPCFRGRIERPRPQNISRACSAKMSTLPE